MTEELNIRRGVSEDIPELVRLYDETVGHLESHVNYPGWKKGVYPGRDAAEEGVETGTLYVAETGGRIIGSIILNGKQEAAYNGVSWGVVAEPDEVMVIHTFLVHPDFRKSGAGNFDSFFWIAISVFTSRLLYAMKVDHFTGSCSGRLRVLPPLALVGLQGTQK